MCKMKMVFQCENQNLVLQKIYMHLVQGDHKYSTPIVWFMGPPCFSFQVMKENMKWRQNKYVQVANGIQM